MPVLMPRGDGAAGNTALTYWLEEQITRLFQLPRTQWDLLGVLPLNHPLAPARR